MGASARGAGSTTAVILLAEDLEDDVLLIRRAFREAGFLNRLQVASNGRETIAYPAGTGRYANRDEYPLPTLLLLDLEMPYQDGFEVLKWISQRPELRTLRVVVLSGSGREEDITRAYGLGANSYLVKPMDFPKFVEAIRAIQGYWIWLSKEPEIAREPRLQQVRAQT